MLVTFKCKHYHDITLFGSVAVQLLKAMGQSGRVPGAITSEHVEEALSKLERAMQSELGDKATEEMKSEEDGFDQAADQDQEDRTINLRERALPLLAMLNTARNEQCDVMWE